MCISDSCLCITHCIDTLFSENIYFFYFAIYLHVYFINLRVHDVYWLFVAFVACRLFLCTVGTLLNCSGNSVWLPTFLGSSFSGL